MKKTNYSELFRCVPTLMANSSNDYFCIWVIPNNLPSYDINERPLHLEFFASSLNQSPAANNELVTITSGKTFTSSWNNDSAIDADSTSGELSAEELLEQRNILMGAVFGLITSIILETIILMKQDFKFQRQYDAETPKIYVFCLFCNFFVKI